MVFGTQNPRRQLQLQSFNCSGPGKKDPRQELLDDKDDAKFAPAKVKDSKIPTASPGGLCAETADPAPALPVPATAASSATAASTTAASSTTAATSSPASGQ